MIYIYKSMRRAGGQLLTAALKGMTTDFLVVFFSGPIYSARFSFKR